MMAQYTSGQYKYLLYRQLQRSFSMKNRQDRAYTQNFFWELFDRSVTVTEAAYNQFVKIMDDQMDYLGRRGIYLCERIPADEVESGSLLLVEAFAQIGITLTITPIQESGYAANFVKPDGKTLVYTVEALGRNYFYINSRAGTEYRYAMDSAPVYSLEDIVVEDGDGIDPKIAGPGTWWSYAAAAGTMAISGSGSYAGATTDEQLGGGAFTTLIVGAEVSRLLETCMVSNETTMVLLHPEDGVIALDKNFNAKPGSCSSSGGLPMDVYTDCAAAIEILSGPDFEKITLHPLSEWEG